MSVPVIRIFSDLHYGDSECRIPALDALAPLFVGVDQIVLNGDTLDTQSDTDHTSLTALRTFFSRHPGKVTWLSGNHDPDIEGGLTELSLLDDRVWITHGDVLFDDIAPWSSLRGEMIRSLTALARDLPASERALIETRLRLNRQACLGLVEAHPRHYRGRLTRIRRLIHTVFPPHRILAMLRAWRESPALARRLARAQRPRARLIVLGHTHHAGVWRETNGITVVNTGTFCTPFDPRFVELRGDQVRVVRIVRRGGEFHPGPVVAEFPLAP
ncbi:MAG: metallophosphoesterase family protein [Opitutaceae bacterium]|nr:metallophosphoesterase family protein [Opitutaceae bacterium]